MKYEKANAEVIKFGPAPVFMTGSTETYANAADALAKNCSGFSGSTKKFSCGVFGGYVAGDTPNKANVTLAGGLYEFDYHGNHWSCSVVS